MKKINFPFSLGIYLLLLYAIYVKKLLFYIFFNKFIKNKEDLPHIILTYLAIVGSCISKYM